ncbi:hypothetical protein RHGRI_035185 [Rhododendron griersonianum]|uniref:Uncharacterized protein n=1 Tax=Rhododendron griersonianum TaxID=479676 RepID=A0AAV6I6R7_9ERIC|nr:hypothetical protein RHGRI_035185 [Rhododendron griersonianum]
MSVNTPLPADSVIGKRIGDGEGLFSDAIILQRQSLDDRFSRPSSSMTGSVVSWSALDFGLWHLHQNLEATAVKWGEFIIRTHLQMVLQSLPLLLSVSGKDH